jgi:hypothetical protein
VPPLADVKDALKKAWARNKRQAKNFMDAQALISDIEEDAKAVSSLAPTIKTLSNKDEAPFGLSPYAMQSLFTANEGDVKLLTSPTGIVIGYVKSVNVKTTISKKDLKETVTQLEAQAPQEIMSAYVSYLQRTAQAQINDKLLEQYYGQKDQ